MANTVKSTNRTIEVSAIDSDYMMDPEINVWSVVFIGGGANDEVYIIEDSVETTDPVKCHLKQAADEPREHYLFGQRLRLGFTFADGTFSQGSKVIFNIGDRNR